MSRALQRSHWIEPLTLEERAAIGEDYFTSCFRLSLVATLAFCGIAASLAFADGQRGGPLATLAVVGAIAIVVAAAAVDTDSSYDWLRHHRFAVAVVGPVCVCTSLWPAVDENAIYYAALGPLMIQACIAQRGRERLVTVASVAMGTFVAALLDFRSPQWSTPGELAGATVGTLVLGVLMNVIVDWWGRKVLLAPDDSRSQDEGGVHAEASDDAHDRALAIVAMPDAVFEDIRPQKLAFLSAREIQLLYLIGDGLTHADIAELLCLSPRTIDAQIQHIRDSAAKIHKGPTWHLSMQLPPLLPGAAPRPTQTEEVRGLPSEISES